MGEREGNKKLGGRELYIWRDWEREGRWVEG